MTGKLTSFEKSIGAPGYSYNLGKANSIQKLYYLKVAYRPVASPSKFPFKLNSFSVCSHLYHLAIILALVLTPGYNIYAQQEPEISFRDGIKYITHSETAKWGDPKALSCSLVQTFGINQKNREGYFEGPGAIYVDKDDYLYVSDYLAYKLKVYDKEGNLFNTISKHNLKQHDFTRPGSVIVDSEKNIYLKCRGIHSIYVFSSTGEFLKSIEIPKFSFGLYQSENYRKFAFSPDYLKKSKDPRINGPIFPFENTGITLPSFGKQLSADPRMDYLPGTTMAFNLLSKEKIAIAYLYPFEIHIYSTNGDLQTVIKRNDITFTETLQYRDLLLLRRRMSNILPFPDGKFMIAYLDRGEDWIERAQKGDITSYPGIVYDLYDSEGIFLQHFIQPPDLIGILRYSDFKGFVYEISEPKYFDKAGKFVVNKYRIDFNGK